MPIDVRELSDEGLADEIRAVRAELDALRMEGADPAAREAGASRLADAGAERARRRGERMTSAVRSGPTIDRDAAGARGTASGAASSHPPPKDIVRHNLRRMNLEHWARRLGIPFYLPPGTDLSDSEAWEAIQTDYYSFEIYLKELEERQQRTSGALAGMDSTDRVIEALRRAIDSGRLDDAVVDALSQLLSPETLKWLPLIVGLGAGLGMLGGGWAVLAGLILAFGPPIYDFATAIYAIVNAENDAEFAAAVELLIKAIGNLGADFVITLASFGIGRGFRFLRNRRRPRGGVEPPARSTPDTPPRVTPPSALVTPPGARRVRPPWLEPPPASATGPRRLSREAASHGMPGRSGTPPPPPPPRGSGPRPASRPIEPEIRYGTPSRGAKGTTSPDGRVVIRDDLKGDDLLRVTEHELAHRSLRPADLPAPQRSALAQRIGRLLESSHIIKTLDEVYAYTLETRNFSPAKFREIWGDWFRYPAWHRLYGVKSHEALRELVLLRRDPTLRRLLDDPEAFARRVLAGDLDLDDLVTSLERLMDVIEASREVRKRRPGGQHLDFP